MNCEHLRELLSPHLDGELTDRDRESVVAHLEECSACREYFEGMQRVVSLIRGIPPAVAPEGFRDTVAAGLPARKSGKGRLLRLLSAAAAVLLVGVGTLGAVHLLKDPAAAPVEVGLLGSDAEQAPTPESGIAASSPMPPDGTVGIGGGAGGAFPGTSDPALVSSGSRDKAPVERSLSYVVSGGKPDATAGLILAELQNRRSRRTGGALREASYDSREPAVLERVVADEEGEPARLVLYLTAEEVQYILTLLAKRNGATRVSGRRSEVEGGDASKADPAHPQGKPDATGKTREPAPVAAPSPPAGDDEAAKEDPGLEQDKLGAEPHRFRVELRFDR